MSSSFFFYGELILMAKRIWAFVHDLGSGFFWVMKGKRFLSASKILRASKRLHEAVRLSTFQPTIIIGVIGQKRMGGAIVGGMLASAAHMSLRFVTLDLMIEGKHWKPSGESINYVTSRIKQDDQVLVVDDLSKTGGTISAAIDSLQAKLNKIHPDQSIQIKAAVIARQLPLKGDEILDDDWWKDNFTALVARFRRVKFPWTV